jgi:hypothetical protein
MDDPNLDLPHSFIIHKYDNSTNNRTTDASSARRRAPKEGKSPSDSRAPAGEAVDNPVGKKWPKKSIVAAFFRCGRRRFVGDKEHEVRGTSARELSRS